MIHLCKKGRHASSGLPGECAACTRELSVARARAGRAGARARLEREGQERILTILVAPIIERWLLEQGYRPDGDQELWHSPASNLAEAAGVSLRRLWGWRNEEFKTISREHVAMLLEYMGLEHLFDDLLTESQERQAVTCR